MFRRRIALSSVALLALAGVGMAPSVLPLRPVATLAPAADAPASLTVYNQNMALVRETRALTLQAGRNDVTLSGLPAQVQPDSIVLHDTTDPAAHILSQSFRYDVLQSGTLLARYTGQTISLTTKDGGSFEGLLLSAQPDVVLQAKSGAITVVRTDQVSTFSLPALSEPAILQPTLDLSIETAVSGTHSTTLTYITRNMSWRTSYNLAVDAEGKLGNLSSWVTLDNTSGVTYQNAQLKLVAGTLNVASNAPAPVAVFDRSSAAAAPAATAVPDFTSAAASEYHVYDFTRPVTVTKGQSSQLSFISADNIPVTKTFVYEPAPGVYRPYSPVTDRNYGLNDSRRVVTRMQFTTGANGLNSELPAGVIRVYQNDASGAPLLIGSDNINHTPKGTPVGITIGQAFDLLGERTQTDFKKPSERSLEESFKITLRNTKAEAVTIQVIEHLPRWNDWEISAESQPHTKLDAQTIRYDVSVPANATSEVTYTVRYKW